MSARHRRAAFVALVAIAVSLNTLWGEFVFDDVQNILQNPWIRDVSLLPQAFTHHMAAYDPRYDTSYYRPIMHVVHAACLAVFGYQPWGFHLLNLLIHAAASACVYLLLCRFCEGSVAPLFGALLFAVHPIHTEPVAWISGIVDLSYGLFSLLTLLAADPRSRLRVFVAPALFLIAALSKEPALMILPVLLLIYAARGELRWQQWRVAAGFAIATAIYFALRINALGGLMGHGGAKRVDVGLRDGSLTALALFGEYPRKLLFPVDLSAIQGSRVVTSIADPAALAGLAALALIAALAWWNRRNTPALVGLSLFLLPLLPALYVPVLGEGLSAERYLYLPSAGAVLFVAAIVDRVRAPALARATGLALLAAGAVASFARNRVWRDSLTLWSDTVRKVPGNGCSHEYLGHALLMAGRTQEAATEFTRSLELDPSRTGARTNLASALAALGRLDEAETHVRSALAVHGDVAEAHAVLAWTLAAKGRDAEAIAEYRKALFINPALGGAHNSLGILLARHGDFGGARAEFEEAVRAEPSNVLYAENLAMLPR